MQLPKRIPWSSLTELEEICAWIYTDEGDYAAIERAVHRLSAWRAITSLPHALESSLSFLTVILQDSATAQSSTSSYSLRQSYATAVIRLVNGLVDPLQSGVYARPIASIAAQLGLPSWFVELRHAATHEDLPSLEVLREASRQSLTWLLHNYFLPVLNPSTAEPPHRQPMRSILPLLKQYKALSKIVTRDASMRTRYQSEITKVLRDIERWLSEAKVAASITGDSFGWDVQHREEIDDSSNSNVKERLALEGLCDGLLEKGSLVPLSKRKRVLATDSFIPPKLSLSLWTLLLSHVQSLHTSFISILVSHIVSRLLSGSLPDKDGSNQHRDASYEIVLASWAFHLLHASEWIVMNDNSEVVDTTSVTLSLMSELGPAKQDSAGDKKAAKLLLQELLKGNRDLNETCFEITKIPVLSQTWKDGDLSVMTERLNQLLVQSVASKEKLSNMEVYNSPATTLPSYGGLPEGWRYVDASVGWRPSPIGVFVPCEGQRTSEL